MPPGGRRACAGRSLRQAQQVPIIRIPPSSRLKHRHLWDTPTIHQAGEVRSPPISHPQRSQRRGRKEGASQQQPQARPPPPTRTPDLPGRARCCPSSLHLQPYRGTTWGLWVPTAFCPLCLASERPLPRGRAWRRARASPRRHSSKPWLPPPHANHSPSPPPHAGMPLVLLLLRVGVRVGGRGVLSPAPPRTGLVAAATALGRRQKAAGWSSGGAQLPAGERPRPSPWPLGASRPAGTWGRLPWGEPGGEGKRGVVSPASPPPQR